MVVPRIVVYAVMDVAAHLVYLVQMQKKSMVKIVV
jgi:hypothetical protein